MGFGPALAPDWGRLGVRATVRCNGLGVALGAGSGAKASRRVAESGQYSYSPAQTLLPAFPYAFCYAPPLVSLPFAGFAGGHWRPGRRLPE